MESSDLASLPTLDALLQEVSVTGAARRLGLSVPAVSHALARLRERLDDPLLVRAGRKMVLSPRAELLRPLVRDAVTAASSVFATGGDFVAAQMKRSFALSATDYIMVVLGPALEDRLRTSAPGLDLRIVPNAVDDPERLRRGETDLAIGIYGDLPPELRTRVLITDRHVCVVRRDHPQIRDRLTLDHFVAAEHIQIAPRGQPGGYVDDQLSLRGLSRRVSRAVPYFQVALTMTAECDAILTVSERIAEALADKLNLRVFEPPVPLEPFALSLVWHPRFDRDNGHAWLRTQCIAAAESIAPVKHAGARRRLAAGDPTTGHGRTRTKNG